MENQKLPFKDERDMQIDLRADNHALTFVKAGIQLLTIACLLKKNPAWHGTLSMLFLGGAAELLYKHEKYHDKPHLYVGASMGMIGLAMLLHFCLKKNS